MPGLVQLNSVLGQHTPTPLAAPQRLNLSDCCLEEVPECLAALRSLTSLTLNMNGALGGGCCARGEGEGGEEGGSMEEGSGGGEGTGGGSGDGSHSSGSAWRLAALAGLTRLQELEMRECELTSVPARWVGDEGLVLG